MHEEIRLLDLEDEVTRSFETSRITSRVSERHILDYLNLQRHLRQKLKY